MPGPMSAPNGDSRLVNMKAEDRGKLLAKRKLRTGKTDKEKGSGVMRTI